MKKKFKMPTAYTVLLIIIGIVALLTWFIPAGQYKTDESGMFISGTYHKVAQNPQGIWDVFKAPILGMIGTETTSGAISICLFILIVGGFLGVVNATKSLDVGIASIVKSNRGKEAKLILILMPLFALGGTTYGMGEETMAFYPIIVPVMMLAGFDPLVGMATVFAGATIGTLCSTVNPFATGVASATAGISLGEGLIPRLVLFILLVPFTIYYVYKYAQSIKKDKTNSLLYGVDSAELFQLDTETPETVFTKKQKNVLIAFFVTFIIMIVSLIPWEKFDISLFETINSTIINTPFLGALIGKDLLPLGDWYFVEISVLFFFMSIVVGKMYGFKENEIVSNFMEGAKDLVSVIFIIAIARGIQVVMNDGQISATILNFGEQNLKNLPPILFSVVVYLFYIPMSFLIPSTSGLASATMGIVAPLGDFVGVSKGTIITGYQMASGLVNFISPTSGILMGALAISKIDYSIWLKFIKKFVVLIFFLSILAMVLLSFI